MIGIVEWWAEHKSGPCPTCGYDLRKLAPESNVFSHFMGGCDLIEPAPLSRRTGNGPTVPMQPLARLRTALGCLCCGLGKLWKRDQ